MKKILNFMKKILNFFKATAALIQKVLDKFTNKFTNTKVGKWLTEGTKWGWLVLAFIVGLFCDSFYSSTLAGGLTFGMYFCSIHKEWKMKGSYLLCVFILVLVMAGFGLAELLTEE